MASPHRANVRTLRIVLEDLDREIVRLLCQDGRMSYTDLGRSTGLSVSAVHQRVRRLEQRGVITSYTARVEPAQVGLPLTAFVAVTPLDPIAADEVPDKLRRLPAVEACHSIAGEASYLLKVRFGAPGDLETLLREIRSAANASTRATIVLSTPFEGRPPAL